MPHLRGYDQAARRCDARGSCTPNSVPDLVSAECARRRSPPHALGRARRSSERAPRSLGDVSKARDTSTPVPNPLSGSPRQVQCRAADARWWSEGESTILGSATASHPLISFPEEHHIKPSMKLWIIIHDVGGRLSRRFLRTLEGAGYALAIALAVVSGVRCHARRLRTTVPHTTVHFTVHTTVHTPHTTYHSTTIS